jgi:hypothetical protein
MKDEIIEFSKQSLSRINEIDEIVDSFTENIIDLTDTASDLVKPIKAFKDVYEVAKKIRFKRFLKSYAKNLDNNFKSCEELSDKLKKYLSNKKNLNYIYDTIDSALNSKSIICSGILGFLSSKVLTKQISIGYKELIFLNALKGLNDIELEMTIRIIENTDDWTKNQTVKNNEKLKPYLSFCEYTVQRLKTLQIVEEIHGRPGNPVSIGQAFWGTYTLTEISKDFLNLIKESGFYSEIKTNMASA